MASERIRGRVARVLNTREIAINRGSEHGVREGMKFAVLSETGEDIRDPETDEVLGSVYRSKVEVQVVTVKERLSIGRTFKTHRRNLGGGGVGGAAIARAFEPPRWVTEYETLKIEESDWEDISESESYVSEGDPVEEVPNQTDGADAAGTHATDVGEVF